MKIGRIGFRGFLGLWVVLGTAGFTAAAWGQEGFEQEFVLRERIVVEADSQKITNFGKPDEKWAMKGNVELSIPYEDRILSCTGDDVVVYMAQEIIHATGNVIVADGTMTIWCHRMDYDMGKRNAGFLGKENDEYGVVWAQKVSGRDELSWAKTNWAKAIFNEGGLSSLTTGRFRAVLTPPKEGADRFFMGVGGGGEAGSTESRSSSDTR